MRRRFAGASAFYTPRSRGASFLQAGTARSEVHCVRDVRYALYVRNGAASIAMENTRDAGRRPDRRRGRVASRFPFPAREKPIAAQAAPPPDCMRHAGCCVVRIVDTECFMRAMQFLPSGLLASARATARSPRCSAQQRHAAAPTYTWGVA
ncbi:hypothetical protein [Burkholderia cepacia]|uniref:hypothetical protein n=1 Tax=Burkholderia cepacia TaxID=292 RepID=UPI0015887FDD|nr:hypothetical protein [Burkholderia cepacia]